MRVNKEVQQGAQMMTLVQQKASVEYCAPDCDDSRLSAIARLLSLPSVVCVLLIVFYFWLAYSLKIRPMNRWLCHLPTYRLTMQCNKYNLYLFICSLNWGCRRGWARPIKEFLLFTPLSKYKSKSFVKVTFLFLPKQLVFVRYLECKHSNIFS